MSLQVSTLKVPIFDFDKGDFAVGGNGQVLTATGSLAVAQVIIKAEQTQRGKYNVYGDLENLEKNHVYGSDVHDLAIRQDLPKDVRQLEMERAAKDAVYYDLWVKEVTSTAYYQETDDNGVVRDMVDVHVDDIFGGSIDVKGVAINGY